MFFFVFSFFLQTKSKFQFKNISVALLLEAAKDLRFVCSMDLCAQTYAAFAAQVSFAPHVVKAT